MSRPATTAIPLNQTSAPKKARVSALTHLRGARADLLEQRAGGDLAPDQAAEEAEHRAAREQRHDQTADERAVARARARPGEPGTSGRSGTIAIPDITSRFHPVIVRGNGPDAAHNPGPDRVWELVPRAVDGGKPTFWRTQCLLAPLS